MWVLYTSKYTQRQKQICADTCLHLLLNVLSSTGTCSTCACDHSDSSCQQFRHFLLSSHFNFCKTKKFGAGSCFRVGGSFSHNPETTFLLGPGGMHVEHLPFFLSSFLCEFKGSSRAPGGWNNGVRHSNDVLQARANVKNNKYKNVYGIVQGFCTCHRRYVRSDPR